MLQIIRHELKQEGNQTTIYLYLDPSLTEFAQEFGEKEPDSKEELNRSVASYVKKKFPNIKDATVKVMVGSMLVTTFAMTPAMGLFKGDKAEAAELTTTQATTATKDFTDLGSVTDTETLAAIKDLKDRGLVQGFEDGTYRPGEKINRGTSALMFYRALGLTETNTVKFPEINKDSTFYAAAQALGQKGVFDGYKDGKYHGEQALSLEQASKALVKAYGLKAVPGAATPDTSKVSTSLVEAVTIAFQNGVLTQADIDRAKDQVDRADFAKYVKRGLDVYEQANPDVITVASTTVTSPTTTTVTLETAKTGLTAKNFTVKINGETVTPTNVTGSADGKTYTITHEDLNGRSGTIDVNGKTFNFDYSAPGVTNVSSLNGKQIQINFNKAVVANDVITAGALKPGAILINPIGTADAPGALKAALSEDGKTLTVTSANVLNGKYAITVVKDTIKLRDNLNVKIGQYSSSVDVNDTIGPAVDSISYDVKTGIVKFNEPIGTMGTISVDGKAIDVKTATDPAVTGIYAVFAPTTDDQTVTIHNLEDGKTHSIAITGTKDAKGNISSPNTINFDLTYTKDVMKPAVALTAENSKVMFNFNKALVKQNLSGTETDYAKVTFGDKTYYLTDAQNPTKDQKTFVLDVGKDIGTFKTGDVVVSSFKDKTGNVGDEFTQSFTLTADTKAPTFQAVSTKDNMFMLKFDEATTFNVSKTTKVNIKYTDPDNVVKTLNNVTVDIANDYDVNNNGLVDGEDDNYVVLTVPTSNADLIKGGILKSGKYEVTVSANQLQDKAIKPNAITSATTFTANVQANAQAKETVVYNAIQSSPGIIKVTYNDDVDGSALVSSNYKIGGMTLPSNSKLYFDQNKKNVVIELPASFITVNGLRSFEVANVKDVNGNILKPTDIVKEVTLTENVKPAATSLALIDDSNIKVNFSESLKTFTAGSSLTGVKVLVNGTEVTGVKGTLSTDGKSITLTKASAFKLSDNIQVQIDETTALQDLNGNAANTGSVSK